MSEMQAAAPSPRRRRWLWGGLAIFAVLAAVLVGLGTWVLTTPSGARYVLGHAMRMMGEGNKLEGVEGRLGGLLRIALIEISRPDMYARIEGVEIDASPLQPLRGLLHVHRLHARSVEVRTVDTGAAARIPVSFAPPYPVRLDDGKIGELRLGDLPKEAGAQKDPARKRELILAARGGDLVIKDVFVKGAGDNKVWVIDEAGAETGYGKGRIAGRLETTAPFALDMRAAFEGIVAQRPYKADLVAKGSLKTIEAKLDGELAGQRAQGRATLEPFAPVPLKLLELDARAIDLSQHGAGPRTRLGLEARLAGTDRQAFAGPVRIENADPGPWDRQQLPFTAASARLVVTPERVDVADLKLALLGGGSASGRATLRRSGVEAELRVADVDLAALHRELQKTRVGGRIAIEGDRGRQRFDMALEDPRFDVDARVTLAGERLDVETARIRTGGGAVAAKGGMALSGRKEFRFEGRGEHFDPSAFVKTAKGDLNFTFVATGALAEGGVAGETLVTIAPSTYGGQPASGHINVAGNATRVARADVELALGEARLKAKGAFGGSGDALDFSFRAPNLSVVGRPLGVQLAGSLDGEGRLTGTFGAPAGRVALNGSNLTLPADVYVREAALRAEAGTAPDSPIDVSLRSRGIALGKEAPPTQLAESLDASLKGTRREHRFEAAAKMTREASVRVALAGGIDPRAREPEWNGRVETLALSGRGSFALVSPATLTASARRVELGEAQLRGEWGEAKLAVTRWTPRTLELKGSSGGIEIQNVARTFRYTAMPRGSLVLAGDWDIHAAETFDATLNVRRVSGDLRVGEPPLPLGLQELALKAESVRGRAHATLAVSGERVGRVTGEGSGQIVHGAAGWEFASNAPVAARLVAEHTNLEALAPWLGADAKLGGRLNANIAVSGTGADPQVSGTARAEDLVLREPTSGFEVEQGQVDVRMSGRSVTIERFTATTPWRPSDRARENFQGITLPASGTIAAEGSVDLGTRQGALRVKLDHAVLSQLATRFLAVSGEARIEANADGLAAAGNFKADAGWIGALDTPPPSVSEDVIVVRAARPAPSGDGEEQKDETKIHVDVRFALGDHLFFDGRGLDTRLEGDIHVTGTAGPGLRANGTIRTAGGTYKGYGQSLTIERGVISFAGPLDNPRLNVLAVRKGLAVEPGVEVTGSAARPRVRLVSAPDVPEPEKLSWLVLGRGPSELAPGDASVLLAAATSMLGGNNPGSDLGKKLGFDEVKIGRSDTNSVLGVLPQSTVAGRTGSASAAEVVSVGKKITRNVHLTYEQGLADAEGTLKVAWQITRQFQLLVRAGFLPGLDAVYRWSFK